MNDLKVIIASVVLAVAAAVGVTYLGPARTDTVREIIREKVGAVSGPELPFDYISLDGVLLHPRRLTSFVAATTTPITVRSPVNATSTLMLGSGCYFSIASTVAKTAVFARSANQNATTVPLFQSASIAASAATSTVATTTTDGFVFPPGNYLNVSLVGGSSTDSPTGHCSFLFIEN